MRTTHGAHGPAIPADPAARWRAVLARDARADGAFVFAVRSTGIYCRPSCPARRPGRSQVAFFDDPAAAEQAGFRACRRCHPREESMLEQQTELVRRACEFIAGAEESRPTLAALARHIGYSPWHLHRMFRRVTGMTPRQYGEAARLGRLKRRLADGTPVTAALYDAGFGSASRAYARAPGALGMTPGAYARGGRGMAIRYTIARMRARDGAPGAAGSGSGLVLVATTPRGVCAVRLGDSAAALAAGLKREFHAATIARADRALAPLVRRLVAFVAGARARLDLALDLRATPFQLRVWEALRAIPRGETRTYAEIARAVGRPAAARAVASACAANPAALVIPCHRVVRSDGGMGGYAWGIGRKRRLLAREAAGSRG